MKKESYVCGLLLALVTRCFSAEAPLHEWETLVQGKHLGAVLSSVDKGELRQWVFIYSPTCTAALSPSHRQMQADFLRTNANLLIDLTILATQRVSTISGVISNTSALLKWRHLLYQHPSYYNLLMAEAVNRALVVQLADKAILQDIDYRRAVSNLVALTRMYCSLWNHGG